MGKWDNIVYNSVIIINTLWYCNREGIQMAHMVTAFICIVSQFVKTKYQMVNLLSICI